MQKVIKTNSQTGLLYFFWNNNINFSLSDNCQNSELKIKLIDFSVLKEIRSFILTNISNKGLTETEVQKIVLAIDEICANLIKHAINCKCQQNPEESGDDNNCCCHKNNDELRKIKIAVRLFKNKVEIKISDNTKPFNILSCPDKDMQAYFTLFQKGGLGIQLVKQIMNTVEYFPRSSDSGHNTLILTKYVSI